MLKRQQHVSPSNTPFQQGIGVRPLHVISDDPYPFYPSTTSNNPVFTFTASSFSASNILGNVNRQQEHQSRQSRYPKVRQKSKSSGASPQKYPSPVEFNDEFINIITSSDSINYGDSCDLFCPAMCSSSRSSNASGRSYLSQQYVQRYGSNSKLLQVPSASSLLLPVAGSRGGRYLDDDEDDIMGDGSRNRQHRSRSITVPIQHVQRSPERATQVSIRRCSSASPQGRYVRLAQEQHQQQQQKCVNEVVKKSGKQGRGRQRGFSLTAAATTCISSEWQQQQQRVRRRRSSGTAPRMSGYRRVSNHSVVTPYSTSTSSLSSSSSGSPKKEQKVSPYKRHRTLSMPSCGVTAQLTRQLKKESTPESPDSASTDKGQSNQPKLKKSKCYDVVIIGSSNVGKATLAEFFSKGGSSGSDPGIGSDFEEDDDQDLCNGGTSILYKPKSDLKQQYDFSLRIFHQQNSAASHLYKYDAVLIVYSITDRESFQFAKDVLSNITLRNSAKRPSRGNIDEEVAGSRPRIVILVGNKTDLERSRLVTTKEGKYLATLHGCKFIEVSASLDLGVDNLTQGLMTQVHLRHQKYMEAHQSSAGESSSSSTSVAISKSSSSSSTSGTTKGSSSAQQRQRKKRSNSRVLAMGAATQSFKLAQRLIDKLMSIRGSSGKSKSCLDLHSL
ncbi:unnamed protein product [Orchesella dallaii]|uniref:GTP-binding protein REM 1 n=1 Tax=Orchesella dallaii TaxID=48710 RepID=A0ABP1QQE1_9HEXA